MCSEDQGCQIPIKDFPGPEQSTAGNVFALHVADPGLIPGIPYGPPSPSGVISECRARSNSSATGMTPPKNKK